MIKIKDSECYPIKNDQFKVIGNVHENAELLEKEK